MKMDVPNANLPPVLARLHNGREEHSGEALSLRKLRDWVSTNFLSNEIDYLISPTAPETQVNTPEILQSRRLNKWTEEDAPTIDVKTSKIRPWLRHSRGK